MPRASGKLKVCATCKKRRRTSKFGPRRQNVDGLRSDCRDCAAKEAMRRYFARTDTDCEVSKVKHRESVRAATTKGPGIDIYLLQGSKVRAKQKCVPHDIDLKFIRTKREDGVCEVTGWPIDILAEPHSFFRPSLDRIVPHKGYVRDNVRLVCYGVNVMLSSYGEETLLKIADAIRVKRNVYEG